MSASHPLEISVSPAFLNWIDEERLSLAFTSAQASRLFLVGLKASGRLSVFERQYDRPSGLWSDGERILMAGRAQIWQFENALPTGENENGYDRLYVPRLAYTTGDLNIHDLALNAQGRPVFASALFSCVGTTSERHSFSVTWQPAFISQLAAEDRCHLSGLALRDGAPRYATAFSQSDSPRGWNSQSPACGVLLDTQAQEPLLTGLSLPHSPRWREDRIWLLNSGTGELGWANLERGVFEPLAFCPGYLRGLAFHGPYALVGLSMPGDAQSGPVLNKRLGSAASEARCGLWVIDLRSGQIVHWLQIAGLITEINAVAVLPGVRQPMALGFKTDEINRLVTMEHAGRTAFLKTPVSGAAARAPQDGVSGRSYHYQFADNVSAQTVGEQFDALSFPRFKQEMRSRSAHRPLTCVLVSDGPHKVGMALAERRPDNDGALITSLFVQPDQRRLGLARGLLHVLEQGLASADCPHVDLSYNTDWSSCSVIEHLLQTEGWLPPQVYLFQYRGSVQEALTASGVGRLELPPGVSLFPWSELLPAEREEIRQRKALENWYPESVDPFQMEGVPPFGNSLGLRSDGRVCGWMVTHQVNPETVQYTSLFTAPELREKGRSALGSALGSAPGAAPGAALGYALVIEAARRQLLYNTPNLIFEVEASNRPMCSFTQHYLAPYFKVSQVQVARKMLKASQS